MSHFIAENAGTLVFAALVIFAAFGALRSVVRTRKKGGCGGSCGCCEMDCVHRPQ